MPSNKKTLTIILPIYNEALGLEDFFNTLTQTLSNLPEHIAPKLLCIDDGSSDQSYKMLQKISANQPHITLIKLSRNFGKEMAIKAGFDHANADAIILMDSDLEHPPQLIPNLIQTWEGGVDCVHTYCSKRASFGLKNFLSSIFYTCLNKLSGLKLQQNFSDFCLLDKKVVHAIQKLPERKRFTKGIYHWVGFSKAYLPYEGLKKSKGQSKWGLFKLWEYAIDSLFSFSTFPLKVWSYLGLILSFSSFLYAAYIVYSVLNYGIDVPGYASIITLILFFNGIVLISLGILGEYVSRIVEEVKARPHYIIDKIHPNS